MRDLPAGINREASHPEDVYKGVEDKLAREELKALYTCMAINQTAVAILFAVTGLVFETLADATSYVYQHTTSTDVAKILMVDMRSSRVQ